MIIDDFYVLGSLRRLAEANLVLVVDADGVLALAVFLEGVKAVAGGDLRRPS